MELVVFDLDGTLLNKQSSISAFTADTLNLMKKNGIAYTVATGRTFNSAQPIIAGHNFILPHIYSNGVLTWYPEKKHFTLDKCLNTLEARDLIEVIASENATPFLTTINHQQEHTIFHPELQNAMEKNLMNMVKQRGDIVVRPIEEMPDNLHVTNISMLGPENDVNQTQAHINSHEKLIAYSGPALEGNGYKWIDIHHHQANKGEAILQVKKQLNVERIIAFGDSDNDLSMFAISDERYAPQNAKKEIQNVVDQVIGDHDEEGVAKFLRERFNL